MPANALCLVLLLLCLLPLLLPLVPFVPLVPLVPAVSESIKCSNFNQLFDNKFHELFKFDGNRNHKLTPSIGVGAAMKAKGWVTVLGKGLSNGAANGKQLQALPLSELPLLAPQLNHKLHVLRTWIQTQVLLSNGAPPPRPLPPLLQPHSSHPTSASCYTEF